MNERNKKWRLEGFVGVFLAFIIIFLILPFFKQNIYTYMAFHGCFLLLILSMLYSVNSHRWMMEIQFFLVSSFIIFDVLSLVQHSMFYMLLAYGFSAAFIGLVIVSLFKKFFYAPVVDTNLLCGALTVYFLVGLLWSKLYLIVNLLFPGSFHGVNAFNFSHSLFSDMYELHFNLLYYSFIVLTTLGLGDIIPVHNQAKALTLLEATFGQLFVAIIITKLVSVWRQTPYPLAGNHSDNSDTTRE